MLISLALSFARQGNGQRATSWVTVARTLAPPLVTSLTCAFFHALLLETLILLYQLGYDVRRRLRSTLSLCLKNTNVYNCLRPRVFTYLAFVKLLRGKTRDAHTALARAMHFAQLYGQDLDIIRIKHCKRAWFADKKPKNLLNRVLLPGKRALTSKKIHSTLLEEEGEEPGMEVYTLPLLFNETTLPDDSAKHSNSGADTKSKEEFTDIEKAGVAMVTITECDEHIVPDTDSSVNLIIQSCA